MSEQLLQQIIESQKEILTAVKNNTNRIDTIDQKVDKLGIEFEGQRTDIKAVAEGHIDIDRNIKEIKSEIANINNRLTDTELQVKDNTTKLRIAK